MCPEGPWFHNPSILILSHIRHRYAVLLVKKYIIVKSFLIVALISIGLVTKYEWCYILLLISKLFFFTKNLSAFSGLCISHYTRFYVQEFTEFAEESISYGYFRHNRIPCHVSANRFSFMAVAWVMKGTYFTEHSFQEG